MVSSSGRGHIVFGDIRINFCCECQVCEGQAAIGRTFSRTEPSELAITV